MELAAHPFPAPRGLLLEAEQLLRERFFLHCQVPYAPDHFPNQIIPSRVERCELSKLTGGMP